MSSSTKPMAQHHFKINEQTCNYCKLKGHRIRGMDTNGKWGITCPQIIEKEKRKSQMFPELDGVLLTKQQQREIALENRSKIEKHQEFLAREKLRKERDETKILRQKDEGGGEDEHPFFEEVCQEREASILWEEEEEEREDRRSKMTRSERLRDEMRQQEQEEDNWEAYCAHYDSTQYYAKCFLQEKKG